MSKYPCHILELQPVLWAQRQLGEKPTEVHEEGEVRRGEKPEEDLGDGELVSFECAVGVEVKISVCRPLWGLASSTSFFFLFFLSVPTRVFALHTGLDGPVPESGINVRIEERGGETRDES
jgi:hypothetical protein